MKISHVLLTVTLLVPGAAFAVDCDVYDEAITACAAKDGCDTSIDDFAECLVEEQGIAEMSEDGRNEVDELVQCFHTQYHCE